MTGRIWTSLKQPWITNQEERWVLVELDQHATFRHFVDVSTCRPDALPRFVVEATEGAVTKPPSMPSTTSSTVTWTNVVVTVRCTERPVVGVPNWIYRCCQWVPGVSAVPADWQGVQTDLITDRKRWVFSRIPLIIHTLDLIIKYTLTSSAQKCDFSAYPTFSGSRNPVNY